LVARIETVETFNVAPLESRALAIIADDDAAGTSRTQYFAGHRDPFAVNRLGVELAGAVLLLFGFGEFNSARIASQPGRSKCKIPLNLHARIERCLSTPSIVWTVTRYRPAKTPIAVKSYSAATFMLES
jgi:hypothetical protein